MILETIKQPADLRRLSYAELDDLAGEIRDFIVQVVSENAGHLGSNLGAVELTLALHRVFDSPRDAILWDTGHQAYVHKLVTGRQQQFTTLRQGGGLSGYPCRAESDHDFVENSHASTILSYAYGLAVARDAAILAGEPDVAPRRAGHRIVAVIGDGSMTGGMAYEALNNLGHSGRNVIIVLNDNGRSYAPTVSNLSKSLTQVRLNPVYMRRQKRLEQLVRTVPLVGSRAHKGMEAMKAAVREMWEPATFFEPLGVRYMGPVDGHRVEDLEKALRNAAEFDGPIVLHVLTDKGRGYPPAEDDDEKHLHDAPVFDPAVGPPRWVPVGYTQAFAEAMIKEAESNPKVVAITAAMPGPTGLLPFQERWPDRFFDVGIAEQHAVTAATGMAMGGLRPVVAIYSTFMNRAWDQVMYDCALHEQPIVFCLDRAGITGDDGPSTHGVMDIALFSKVPGMTVFAPSSAQELQVMLHDALDLDGPSVVRYPRGAARQVPDDQVGSGLQARLVRRGAESEVCLLAVGKLVAAAEAAATELEASGVDCTVWDVRVVKPLDTAMIADAARHPLVVTVEDGVREGGAGSLIVDALAAHCAGPDIPRVEVLGTPIRFLPHGKPDRILTDLGLDGPGIAATIRTILASLTPPLPMTLDLDAELALALRLADAADSITLPRYRAADLSVRHKADATEVTDADTASEAAMRALLARERRDHAVLGEEEGLIGDPDAASRWILDPIDGTASFVRGLPIWGTLIALEHGGEIVVGVASAPALGRRWWAARGKGAFSDHGPMRVSTVERIEDAQLGHASISSWREHGRGPQFAALADRVWRSRGVGDFWMHVLVAEGVFDIAAEPIVSLWDLAAVKPIVEEAGGQFTDLAGEARADGGSALSTNGLLHDAALAALR